MQMRAGVARKTIKSIRQQAFEQTHLFDSHPESSLDFDKVRSAVKDGYDKPFLLIDSGIVREKTRRFTAAMPRVRPHYAVKANPDPRVLKTLVEEGVGFEIDSVEELGKIHSIKSDARLYLRIDTPNIGSDWPLAGKFGAHAGEAREIILAAARLKSDLAGVA